MPEARLVRPTTLLVFLVSALLLLLPRTPEANAAVGICSAFDVSKALASATPGTTVRLGSCTITGSFVVPAGVTLDGAGAKMVIQVVDGTTGVTLQPAPPPGNLPTTLKDVTIVSDGRFAVRTAGAGAVAVDNVNVNATRGIGIGAESTTALALNAVTATGPVTAATASTIPFDATALTTATHGIALVNVGAATLTNVNANGFAQLRLRRLGPEPLQLRILC